MDKNSIKGQAIKCLRENADFLEKHYFLCNVHTVDFITGEKWLLLSSELRKELIELEWEQLKALPNKETPDFLNEKDFPELYNFICNAKAHTLEAFNISTSLSKFLSVPLNTLSDVSSRYWCMSPKKIHEVKAMAAVVSSLAKKYKIKTVVDAGSGKGYLSHYLALEKNLNVLGIEESSGNALRAGNRSEKVSYFWSKSNNKRHEKNEAVEKNHSSTHQELYNTTTICLDSKENSFLGASEKSASCSSGVFISKTHSVHESTDISSFIKDFLNHQIRTGENSGEDILSDENAPQSKDEVIFCTLHGCGNLSSTLLKLYTSTYQAKVICCVGCCYNHIEERFFRNPFPCHDNPCSEFGFPLSSALLERKYSLGRNARMLASQSIDRFARNKGLLSKSLFYRAVLQIILSEKSKEISLGCHVGKIASKCTGFVDYVQKAFLRLKLQDIQMSSCEIEEYLNKYSEDKKKLYAFQLLRIILSPCVEALILLDRLVFLLEQECIEEAYLVQLFDPITSPRCYGLIAVKS